MKKETCDFGKFLKAMREDLDLTQTEVMKKTGINNKTLSGYENNVAEPDLRTLSVLAELYGFSVDTMLGLNNDEEKSASERVLLKCFRALSESDKKKLIDDITSA